MGGTLRSVSEPAVSDSTRDRLLQAAVDVFAEVGYDGARVHEIATRAGLTTGAIYSQFRGKADLLLEAIAALATGQMDRLLDAPESAHDVAGIFEGVGTRLPEGDAGRRRARLLLFEAVAGARRDDEVARLLREHTADRIAALAALVRHGQREGTLDPDLDAEAVADFAMALSFGFLVYEALGLRPPERGPWGRVIRRIVGALRPPAP